MDWRYVRFISLSGRDIRFASEPGNPVAHLPTVTAILSQVNAPVAPGGGRRGS
jgi:hypothetical protein